MRMTLPLITWMATTAMTAKKTLTVAIATKMAGTTTTTTSTTSTTTT